MSKVKTIPKLGRQFYRSGNDFKIPTFGLYPGFVQANISIVPSQYAGHFKDFCRKNPAPLPLLSHSKAGAKDTDLAEGSDITTDISTYQRYENGKPDDEALSDLSSHPCWDDMVTFYLGCSFSFDHKLKSCGVNMSSSNVAMFITNIRCVPSGPFDCNMVVSMRPIPRKLLNRTVALSVNMDFAHGAPIHIGDPSQLGIVRDSSGVLQSDKGDPGVVGEGEVPCFWACGVTGNIALQKSKLPVAFSHSPGCMFVTDITSDAAETMFSFPSYPEPEVLCLDEVRQRYATLSTVALGKLRQIEEVVVGIDPANRGIRHMRVPGDFCAAVLELSLHARSVGILVGFPLLEDCSPAEENDGIAGAVYLARALSAIGITVTVLVDESADALKKLFSECFSKGFIHENVQVLPIGSKVSGLSDISRGDGVIAFSHLIAIERPSPAEDGRYYTMTGRDISGHVGAMAEIFRTANSHPDVTTIGIGDGGNEVGMGKVKAQVKKHITHGGTIAAEVSCDYLVTCGVSNWGGLAIAAGLYAVRSCLVHDRYRRRGIGFREHSVFSDYVLDSEKELELHCWITEEGFRDGVTGKNELTIDGLDYHDHHSSVSEKLRKILTLE